MPTSNESLIIRAAKFAKMVHKGQLRKYTNRPFIEHPLRVAMRHATQLGATEAGIAAAWLHDTQEDCGVSREQLRALFGEDVADYVGWLTNPSKGLKELRAVRKQMDREHVAIAPRECKIVKLIDRIDNLREIDQSDDFAKLYARESLELVKVLAAADKALAHELTELATKLCAVSRPDAGGDELKISIAADKTKLESGLKKRFKDLEAKINPDGQLGN